MKFVSAIRGVVNRALGNNFCTFYCFFDLIFDLHRRFSPLSGRAANIFLEANGDFVKRLVLVPGVSVNG